MISTIAWSRCRVAPRSLRRTEVREPAGDLPKMAITTFGRRPSPAARRGRYGGLPPRDGVHPCSGRCWWGSPVERSVPPINSRHVAPSRWSQPRNDAGRSADRRRLPSAGARLVLSAQCPPLSKVMPSVNNQFRGEVAQHSALRNWAAGPPPVVEE